MDLRLSLLRSYMGTRMARIGRIYTDFLSVVIRTKKTADSLIKIICESAAKYYAANFIILNTQITA